MPTTPNELDNLTPIEQTIIASAAITLHEPRDAPVDPATYYALAGIVSAAIPHLLECPKPTRDAVAELVSYAGAFVAGLIEHIADEDDENPAELLARFVAEMSTDPPAK